MFRNDQKVKKERKRGWLSYPSSSVKMLNVTLKLWAAEKRKKRRLGV
jgi:hypothetical protein